MGDTSNPAPFVSVKRRKEPGWNMMGDTSSPALFVAVKPRVQI
ncbi:hypothetical protein AHiyo6_27980 [Arthrobacter sp. Hiyo6]|nr:hypothetical protein AHiyo6_27980 [Arthrobacter sp. Hiyo6]